MLFDKDAGHTQFMEDVYENQSRYPAGSWDVGLVPWTDVVSIYRQGRRGYPGGTWDVGGL